ncbi:carboxymuconolactone decarboxylase family protein [Burkholderia guangdongensis]|uniref:carboxymuconolactone decarboxylase family protein n=1 Tax=Burkholderia guangdongensis TaxID=1792500 RepID=UPI0015CC0A26|nr:peroxidase [Burkholderia guangdongensis]
MPFLASLSADAGPPSIYMQYPDIYGPWSTMSEALMNGPSPLSQGERELILAYACAVAGCALVHVAHSEVAYAWGIPQGAVEQLLEDPDGAPVDARFKVLLHFVRKLMLTPNEMNQDDFDAVLQAGWSEQALHDAVAVTARGAFMHRLIAAYGFRPMSREAAARKAQRRKALGYVKLYPGFASTAAAPHVERGGGTQSS